jgi:hypothetical protein
MNSASLYYYIALNGETEGPVKYADLQSYLKSGQIKPTTLICKVGDAAWAPFLPDARHEGLPPNESPVREISQTERLSLPGGVVVALWIIVLGVLLNTAVSVFLYLSAQPTFSAVLSLSASSAQLKTWEYRVVEYPASAANDRSTRSINLNEQALQSAGRDGWEIVGQWLEHETVYPNFGKDEYVTGIQPNFRPSKLVVLMKRPSN